MTGIRAAASTLLLLSACSGDGAVDASETTGDTEDPSVGTEIGGADTSTSTPAPESSGADASPSSESSSSGDESSSTGAAEQDILELVISGRSPSDERGLFRYRRVDGVAEELVRLVDYRGSASEALFFADRLAVFPTDTAIWLAELDGDEDSATRLDVAPLSGGPFRRTAAIPDAEAIVILNQADRNAYRVDVEGAVAAAPVLVAHDMLTTGFPNGVVDPLGRWLMFDLDEGRGNVALAAIDMPDGDSIQITSEVAPASARYLGFLPDGGGLLYEELVDIGDIYDPATALYFVGLDGTSMAAPQLVHAIATPDTLVHSWSAHPSGLGFAFVVGPDYGPRDLWFCPVVDGVAGAAVLVVEDASIRPPMWSPDGSRFVVDVNDWRGLDGLVLVSIVDGEPGAVVPIDAVGSPETPRFAPDGSWIYFEYEEGDTRALVRVALTDDGWDDWQVVAADDVRDIEDLDADGSTLLYSVMSGPTMLAVDVSGAVPAAPLELGGPLPANIWNETGQLTPDGRFALLQQEVGDFGPYRLVLVDLAAPETSEEIMADVRIAQVVPGGS